MRMMRASLALLLLLALPGRTAADPELTTLVLIPGRVEDASLHEIAHARAYEASLDWSHDGMRPGTAEILAQGPDPVAQWWASPSHAAILADPYWNRVACGTYDIFAACVFTHLEPPAPPVEVPDESPAGTQSTPSAKEPSESVTTTPDRTPALPDTALEAP